MDPTYAPEAEAYRLEIRTFLDKNLPEGWEGIGALPRDDVLPFIDQWRKVLHAHDHTPATGEFLRLGAVTVPAGLVASVAALWVGLRIFG